MCCCYAKTPENRDVLPTGVLQQVCCAVGNGYAVSHFAATQMSSAPLLGLVDAGSTAFTQSICVPVCKNLIIYS